MGRGIRVLIETKVVYDCHVSNVLVIGGRPKAAQEHLVWRAAKGRLHWTVLAGMYGGRRKAAIDHAALSRAAEGRPCLQFVDPCACV